MNPADIPIFIQAQLDQVTAIIAKDEDAQRLIAELLDPWMTLRRMLINDNGIAAEIADAMLTSIVAGFAACAQLDIEE